MSLISLFIRLFCQTPSEPEHKPGKTSTKKSGTKKTGVKKTGTKHNTRSKQKHIYVKHEGKVKSYRVNQYGEVFSSE